MEDYRFTKVFLGAAGIIDEGMYYYYEDDICFKRELVKRAEQVIVLADHTKFEKCSFFKVLDFNSIDVIITDQPVSKELHQTLENAGVQLITIQNKGEIHV